MQRLEPPDCHYLLAAIGWIELGNLAEAEAELQKVSARYQQHPDVLETHWSLRAQQQRWGDALQAARALLHAAPERASGWIQQAYALRRAPGGGLEAAREALLPALEKFPDESTIPFNLACYACQSGNPEDAKHRLKQAVAIAGKQRIKQQALQDADLRDLWDEISAW